jgi:hypothetical protein
LPRHLQDGQLRALQVELSGSCTLLQGPAPAASAGLGTRIEQVIRLAEEQAAELIGAAPRKLPIFDDLKAIYQPAKSWPPSLL